MESKDDRVRPQQWLVSLSLCLPSLPPSPPQDARELKGSPESVFHVYVKERHKGLILPPFNDEARRRAGMREEWYLPLVTPKREGRREGACEEAKQKK